MLLDIVKKGSTDRSVLVRIIDETTGVPETGVLWNTSGIDLWYRREGAAKTSITEASLSALTDAHADGGFLHVGDGYYRLDLPDAAYATGANYVDVGGAVTGMVVIGGRVRLTDIDFEDAGVTAAEVATAVRSELAPELQDVVDARDDVAVIKAKTDQFAFTSANKVDANVKSIDDDDAAAAKLEAVLDGSEYLKVDPHHVKFSISGSTLTVYLPDGTTVNYSRTLTTDANAEPVIGVS